MSIPITKPLFGEQEVRAVAGTLQSGWVVQGPSVARFEEMFCAFTGAAHAAAASSCTAALHLAVAALGVKPGDEVIVPAFTWVSTANVVEYMGAKPVFCDVELDTFNIDTNQIESLITPRCVGIIPVHLFGLCAAMQPIMDIAQKHGLWVVEDAACAFGGWYRGRHAGTIGDVGCFSFHPRKSITTGEGGMVTTEGAELDHVIRSLRDHGASRSDLDRHRAVGTFLLADFDRLGYNYRLTDIQGAIGCEQMKRAEWILDERRARATAYDEMIKELDWLRGPVTPDGYVHGYQAYVCLFQPERSTLANTEGLHQQRNLLMARLEERGIATRQGTHAAALQTYYAEKYDLLPAQFPNSYLADRLTLTLPLYVQMTKADQQQVIDSLTEVFSARVAA